MIAHEPSIETKVIHAGEPRPGIGGAVSMPIFQSSTFEYTGEKSYHDLRYIRLNNTPNHRALHQKLAALENAEEAVVMGSGMAAITTTLLTLLSSGDHLLAQNCLYGGTHDFLTQDLPSLGIQVDFVDGNQPESWREKLRPTTRLLYVESMTNPLLEVADLEAVVRFCREHGLLPLIDNTFPSPFNFRPCERGFDLSLHSCSKYLNGHSDLVAGAVMGKGDLVIRILHKLNHLGGSLDPHACFLLQRGIKTLAVRMACHNQNALAIARFLENHPRVRRVHYPGLTSHPQHERAKELFNGFSGMMSFELDGDVAMADRFMGSLQLPVSAPSLGGIETLITRPATTSHAGMTPEDRHALGIGDNLIRLSVGIEGTQDLITDLETALERA